MSKESYDIIITIMGMVFGGSMGVVIGHSLTRKRWTSLAFSLIATAIGVSFFMILIKP